MLSNPGNPNLIISATRLIPFSGSGGISSNKDLEGFFSFNEITELVSVVVVDKTTGEAADTVAKIGKHGGLKLLLSKSFKDLFQQIPAKKPLPLARNNFILPAVNIFNVVDRKNNKLCLQIWCQLLWGDAEMSASIRGKNFSCIFLMWSILAQNYPFD
jgi:hypothetical protein